MMAVENVINLKSALDRLQGDTEIYLYLVQSFLEGYPSWLHEVRQMSEKKEVNNTRLLIHTYKGLSAQIGADDFSTFLATLNRQLLIGEIVRPEQLGQIQSLLSVTVPALESLLELPLTAFSDLT